MGEGPGRIRDFLAQVIPPVTGDGQNVPAEAVLLPLVFAEEPGLPAGLWRVALRALGCGDLPEAALSEFGRSVTAALLVEPEGEGPDAVFRLSNQAVRDALRDAATGEREQALTLAFLAAGREAGWDRAPAYLLRSLPAHAARAELVDDLLADDGYPLHADLDAVLKIVDDASSPAAKSRGRLLRRSPQAVAASPAERAAVFSLTEAMDGLGSAYREGGWPAPYRARWAATAPADERGVLRGHQANVTATCAVTVDGQQLLASADTDGTVRLWDPINGRSVAVLASALGCVEAMCPVTVGGRELLAAGGGKTVRLLDPRDGSTAAVLEGHQDTVRAVCAITVDGRELLASGEYESGTVRLWDPVDGRQVAVLAEANRTVDALCAVTVDGRELLAVGSINDNTVPLWDPGDGRKVAVLDDRLPANVYALCTITLNGRDFLAVGADTPEAWSPSGAPGTVRLWDPRNGREVARVDGDPEGVRGLCAITVDGRDMLAFCGDGGFAEVGGTDGSVRLWDPRDDADDHFKGAGKDALQWHKGGVDTVCAVRAGDRELLASGGEDTTVRLWSTRRGGSPALLEDDLGEIYAACPVTVDGQQLLATGSADHTVRLWDPLGGWQSIAMAGHRDWAWAVCSITVDGQTLLASGSRDTTVRLWDPRDGRPVTVLNGHERWVNAVCPITVDGRELLASGSDDRTVRLWDPRDGRQTTILEGHQREVTGMCAVTVDGRELLATASGDKTVRLWDPGTGERLNVLEGHQGWVWSTCAITVGGRQLLATGSQDTTVRLWDPATGHQLGVLEGHQGMVRAMCAITVGGRALLATAGDERENTVRLWDPSTRTCLATVPTRTRPNALAAVSGSLAIGTDAGILMINPSAT